MREDSARRSSENVILSLNHLPPIIKEQCQDNEYQNSGIPCKYLLYEIVTMGDEKKMLDAWDRFKRGEFTITEAKKEKAENSKRRKTENPSRKSRYEHESKEHGYKIVISFRKGEFSNEDILEAVENEARHLRGVLET